MDQLYLDLDPLNLEASPGKGQLSASRIIVGNAPALNRPANAKNEPFGLRSQQIIRNLAEHFPDLYLTNFMKVPHPLKKKIPVKLQKYWAPRLYAELELVVTPKSRVLTLGMEVSKLLCPGFTDMRQDHGTAFYNPQLDCEVIPTYHFSVAQRNPQMKDIITRDLQRFFEGEFLTAQPFVLQSPKETLTDDIYLDIETTGLTLFDDTVMQIGILLDKKTSPAYIAAHPTETIHKKLFQMLKGKTLIGHNIAFDLAFLEYETGLPWTHFKVKDTMLAAYVLGESVLSLKHLVTSYTDRRGSHSGGSYEDPQYLAEDLAGTKAIAQDLLKRAKQQWISKVLYSLSPRIARMRLYGVNIDWVEAELLARKYQRPINAEFKRLQKIADINWNSTDQVAQVLLKAGVPLTVMTSTGKYATSAEVLREFEAKYPIVTQYFKYKDLLHELSFIESYKELRGRDLRLHPKFNLTGAATGRSSMSHPNLQQVPRVGPLKTLFTSRFENGYFGLIDLSQAELRIAALLSNDAALAEALMKEDVHRFIASRLYNLPVDKVSAFQRKKSKGVTFGLLYGGGASGLAERIGVEEKEVKGIMKTFYGLFPTLAAYIREQKDLAVLTQQSVTPLGRIRDLRQEIAMVGDRRAERIGINTPIQGTANDVMFIIVDSVFEQLEKTNLQSGVIFGVHDSSAHDIHPAEREAYAEIVQNAFLSLNTTPLADYPLWKVLPLTGEFLLGRNWAQVESTNEKFYSPLFRYDCSSLGVR